MHRPATRMALPLLVALLCGAVAPAHALPNWRSAQTHWENSRDLRRTPRVVDVRHATHDGYDRVVIVLRGGRPDYLTIFADELAYDPSGKPVPLRGRHQMYVVLRPAVTYTPDGESVYAGPRLVRPGYPSLRGLALTGSWEGDTSFGLTARHRPYRIFTLTHPSRVVVDLKH